MKTEMGNVIAKTMSSHQLTDSELKLERACRIQERLGITCEKNKPTPEQMEQVQAEVERSMRILELD